MTVFAGKGIIDRLPPPPNFQFPASYPTSEIFVPLVSGDAQGLSFVGVAAADLARPIPILLFLSDYPGRKMAWSRYLNAGPTATSIFARYDPTEPSFVNVGGTSAAFGLLLAGATVVTSPSDGAGGANLGQAVFGTTITHALPRVGGYPMELTPEDLGMIVAGPAAADINSLRVWADAQSPVKDSRGNGELIEYLGTDTVNPQGGAAYPNRTAVILEEPFYTAAVRAPAAPAAAGQVGKGPNQLLLADGTVVDVVGIFSQNPAA